MENKDQPAFHQFIPDSDIFKALLQEGLDLKGLTKREYFAGLAMQGLLANSGTDTYKIKEIANESIAMADELLTQLNDTTGK